MDSRGEKPAGNSPEQSVPLHSVPVQTIEGFIISKDPQLRPLQAMRAVIRLLRNKEDTSQVFEITRALTGKAISRTFGMFARSAYGRRVMTEPIEITQTLSDFEGLRKLPAGSFGRVYLAFMEGGGLTPDGITKIARQNNNDFDAEDFPELLSYFRHATASHDIWHVLTGYGRDALGEICVLAFTRAQIRNDSLQLIVSMGMLAIKKERWSLPVRRIVAQAARTGRAAEWLYGVDLMAMLAMPLADVRARLKIPEPSEYLSVDRGVRDGLLKPATNFAS